MAITKIINAVARPKINFHFPDFSVYVANGSEVSALYPVHAGVNEVGRPTIFERTHPVCIGLFSGGRLIS